MIKDNMKMKNKSKFSPLGIVICVLLLAIIAYIAINKKTYQMPQSTTQNQIKTYYSKNMKFSIQISSNFEIKDNYSEVDLVSSDSQISIVKNGTNFGNLDSYISDFDSKRKLVSLNSKKVVINGYEALSRVVKFPEENIEQKSYYIYVNNYVYTLSTSSPSLYGDLDQIAQSFRYTP